MESLDEFTKALIDQYIDSKTPNEEFEQSMLVSLIYDRKHELIIYALSRNFILSNQVIEMIRKSGILHLYEYLFSLQELDLDENLLHCAIKSHNLETVQWCRNKGCPWALTTVKTLYKAGNKEILEWCRNNGCYFNKDSVLWAIKYGHIHLVEEVPSFKKLYNVVDMAAEHGQLEMMKYLISRGYEIKDLRKTALNGHFHILKWIHHNYLQSSAKYFDSPSNRESYLLCYAIMGKHLEIIKWLHKHGFIIDNFHFNEAVDVNSIPIVTWIIENHPKRFTIHACDAAAKNGNLEMMKLLRNYNIGWGYMTFNLAARSGNLELIKWLFENGCPYDKSPCKYAAEKGHIDVLKWLREHHFEWNWHAAELAALNNHKECFVWCLENGCPWDSRILRTLFQSGRESTLKFLFKYISDPEKAPKYPYDLHELKRYAIRCPWSFHFRDMLKTIFEGSKINSCNESLP